MRNLVATLYAGLMVVAVQLPAADPKPYRLPARANPPQPMLATDAGYRLTPAVLFVVDAKSPLVIVCSPKHLVTVSHEKGPIKVRGVFVDGTGKPETRTYAGPDVYIIDAAHAGKGEVIVLPVGASEPTDRIPIEVVDGTGPQPPPDPKPDDPPAPKAKALYLAIIRDPMTVTPEQARLIGDTVFLDSLKRDGHEWDSYTNTSEDARRLNYLTMVEGVTLPALLLLDKDTGRKLRAVPLPKDKAGVTALVKEVTRAP